MAVVVLGNYRAEVNEADLQEAKRRLTAVGANVPRAIRNILNRVGRKVRKELVVGMRARYNFKPGFRIGEITIYQAELGNLTVELQNMSRTRTLRRYKYSTPKSGIKAAVRKGRSVVQIGERGRRAWMGTGVKIAGLISQRKSKAPKAKIRVMIGPSFAKMMEMTWTGRNGGVDMQGTTRDEFYTQLEAEIKKITG